MASKIKVDTLETANGSGTIELSNQLSGMTTASLPALTGAQMPAGSVLQVINAITTTEVSSTSSTYADTGLTAAITPSSTSSKILVVVHQNGFRKYSGDGYANIKLLRATTLIAQLGVSTGYTASTGTVELGTIGTSYLDSPNTTSATTYKTQFANNPATGTITIQVNSVVSTITLIEIKG